MLKVKFGKNDKHFLFFKDYIDVVRFLRSQALPWRGCKRGSSSQSYKAEVAKRAKVMYGESALVRTLSDKEFIMDLYNLGEIEFISQC